MALDQAGVNKLYNSLLGRDAVFGSESDFDADWWLGQSEADVKRGIESGSEFKNRAALVNAAGDAGISEAELDKQVMAGGMKTEFHDDYTGGSILDFNKGNTWFDSIQNSDKFDPFGTTYAKAQNSINKSLGLGSGSSAVGATTLPTGNPITGTANAATDTLPTITDTTVTSDPYGGGVIGIGGPNAGDDVATLQQQIADLVAAGNNNSNNNNNANNNANNNNNSNQQQAAASDGWWTKFADADAFRDFMSGGSSQQSGSEFDQFLKFMQALQGMGGFGGGSGYGYGGYGGFAPGGVRPNVGLNNTMNALNAFKFLGAGSGGNIQTGLLAGLGN